MNTENKTSFLKRIFGSEFYLGLKNLSNVVLVVYTLLAVILFVLARLTHWIFFCNIFTIQTGWSIFFLTYVICLISKLDILIDVNPNSTIEEIKKMPEYRWTIIYGVVLIVLGVTAVIGTNNLRKDLRFDCDTFYVEQECGKYHILKDCDYIDEDSNVIEMKGFEIKDKGYELCIACKEFHEDATGTREYSKR